MKILLSGGGTMGSVSPLLAVVDELRHREPNKHEFLWIGTEQGPEKEVVEDYEIPFMGISAGKFRRYLSVENFFDVFRFFKGSRQAKKILREFQPAVVLTAGSYVSVPVAKAAARLRIPYVVHQQDVLVGLANKIMAKKASRITVSLQDSLKNFPKEKTVLTGNPLRSEMLGGDRSLAKKIFGFSEDIATLLVMGGGTGALVLNEWVVLSLVELTKKYQILHIAGKGKEVPAEKIPSLPPFQKQRYKQYGFLTEEIKHAYAVADLVVCRASFSSITELAHLGKPAILIPIPDSHQVDNAIWLKRNNSAFVLDQKKLTPDILADGIIRVMSHPGDLSLVAHNIAGVMKKNATQNVIAE